MFLTFIIKSEYYEFKDSKEFISAQYDEEPRYDDDGIIADVEEYLFVGKALGGIVVQEVEPTFENLSKGEGQSNVPLDHNVLEDLISVFESNNQRFSSVGSPESNPTPTSKEKNTYTIWDDPFVVQKSMPTLVDSSHSLYTYPVEQISKVGAGELMQKGSSIEVMNTLKNPRMPQPCFKLCTVGYPPEIPPEPPPPSNIYIPRLRTNSFEDGEDDGNDTNSYINIVADPNRVMVF